MTHHKKHDPHELQTKYIQYQVLRQQLTAFMEEKNTVAERFAELHTTIDALHKMEDVEKNNEMWSTLGSGVFVKSNVKDSDNILVAIGAGIVSAEKRERAIEILQERMEQLNTVDREITNEATKISLAIKKLEPELERLAEEQQKEEQK